MRSQRVPNSHQSEMCVASGFLLLHLSLVTCQSPATLGATANHTSFIQRSPHLAGTHLSVEHVYKLRRRGEDVFGEFGQRGHLQGVTKNRTRT